jgi:hypothetical protein
MVAWVPIPHQTVNLNVSGAFTDNDQSANIPAGATGISGVWLSTQNSAQTVGFRKKGSSDPAEYIIAANQHFRFNIGVDENRVWQWYRDGGTANMTVYITGYYTSECVFLTNRIDKSTGTTGSWQTVDISGDVGSDTPIGAFFTYDAVASNIGLRKFGSTDNRVTKAAVGCAIVGLDGSYRAQQQINNTVVDLFLNGWVKSGAVFHTNAITRSHGVAGSYTDMTALPAGAIAGLYEIQNTASDTSDWGIRANGASDDYYNDLFRHAWAIVECDGSGVVESKFEGTGTNIYETGYFTADPDGQPARRRHGSMEPTGARRIGRGWGARPSGLPGPPPPVMARNREVQGYGFDRR